MKDFNKKEMPIQGFAGFGGGAVSLAFRSGASGYPMDEVFSSNGQMIYAEEDNDDDDYHLLSTGNDDGGAWSAPTNITLKNVYTGAIGDGDGDKNHIVPMTKNRFMYVQRFQAWAVMFDITTTSSANDTITFRAKLQLPSGYNTPQNPTSCAIDSTKVFNAHDGVAFTVRYNDTTTLVNGALTSGVTSGNALASASAIKVTESDYVLNFMADAAQLFDVSENAPSIETTLSTLVSGGFGSVLDQYYTASYTHEKDHFVLWTRGGYSVVKVTGTSLSVTASAVQASNAVWSGWSNGGPGFDNTNSGVNPLSAYIGNGYIVIRDTGPASTGVNSVIRIYEFFTNGLNTAPTLKATYTCSPNIGNFYIGPLYNQDFGGDYTYFALLGDVKQQLLRLTNADGTVTEVADVALITTANHEVGNSLYTIS